MRGVVMVLEVPVRGVVSRLGRAGGLSGLFWWTLSLGIWGQPPFAILSFCRERNRGSKSSKHLGFQEHRLQRPSTVLAAAEVRPP